MRKEELLSIVSELDIPLEKWVEFNEIDRIVLESGIGIYPNWKYLRFLVTKDGEILVRHGSSKPYGARLTLNFVLSIDGCGIQLDPLNTVPGTEFYESFRLPKIGDAIRYTNGQTVLGESVITNVIKAVNCISLSVFPALNTNVSGKLSFYSKSEQKELAMHSAPIEGIYMNFIENSGKTHKIYGVFHEIIKAKEIKEIILCIKAKYNQKTFRLGGNNYGSK